MTINSDCTIILSGIDRYYIIRSFQYEVKVEISRDANVTLRLIILSNANIVTI